MLIHNHLNITGPHGEIDIIANIFMRGKPFASLYPLPMLERDTVYAVEEQRRKHWGTPHDAYRPQLVDLIGNSVSLEFWTTDAEPEGFIRFLARAYPRILGVCQFMSDGRTLARSGTMKIGSGKVFTRSYTKPTKEYA